MDQPGGEKAQLIRAFSPRDGSRVVGYLPAGILVWGSIGLLLDHWFGTMVFTPVGLALGLSLAVYLVIHHCVLRPAPEFAAPGDRDEEPVQEKAVS
jgi:F0F1-type ATP synthase assembly protein I